MNIETDYETYRKHAQDRLDAAGFSDVKAVCGHFKNGDSLRMEVRLNGNPSRVAEARKVLPFSDNNQN